MSHTAYQNTYMTKAQKTASSPENGYLRKAEVMEERRTVARAPSLSEQVGEADSHLIARYWG